jgi:AcrR family transcriptional regulator
VQAQLADALLNRRVVLLCAPAGYGKTTALAHEIARLPPEHAVAWISADAGDDLQRLLECMLAALEPFDPPWRTAPESLVTRVGRASTEEQRTLAAEIINTLDACEVAHGINIKLAKSGGIREAIRMAHAARALGLGVMLGCMIESGLGIAAGCAVAPLCDHVDLDGNLLLAHDPAPGPAFVDGVQVPSGEAGLGCG